MTAAREFWVLLKLHLRMRLGLSSMKASMRTGKGKAKIIGFAILMLYVVAMLWLVLGMLLYSLIGSAVEAGIGEFMFGLIIMATMLVALVLGTLSLLGLVFNAKDTELYAALPVRQSSVFAAKFAMVYLTELAFTVFLLLPVGVIYSMHTSFDLWFWLKLIPVMLLIPVVPLVLSCVLAFPLMLLTARSRHRDAVMLVLSLVLLLGVVIGQMYLNVAMQNAMTSPDEIMDMLSSPDGLVTMALRAVPPAMWAAKTLLFGGMTALSSFVFLLLTCAVSFALALLISSKLYYRGALAQLESVKKGKKKGYSSERVRAGKPSRAFASKDMKVILRTPVYAMNQLTTLIILPLLIIIFKVMSGGNEGYAMLIGMLEDPSVSSLTMTLVISAIMGFVLMVNPQSTTTFSRDGVSIFFIKSLPVSVSTQMAGRILSAVIIPALSIVVAEVFFFFLFGFDILVIVSSGLIALSAVVLVTSAAMIPDCIRPKLRWNSEAEAMKQNMNSALGMLTGLISLVPAIVLSIVMVNMGLELPIVTAVLMVLNVGLSFGTVGIATASANKMLENLE